MNLPAPEVLPQLVDVMQAALGDQLIGVYLYGSLVWGDFDPAISDLDLMAALTTDIAPQQLAALTAMHGAFVTRYPAWRDRIEVQYVSIEALRNFRSTRHSMANISPGEPLHLIEAGDEWLMNWYFVLSYGLTLLGPPPDTLIPPLTRQDFITAAADHARAWTTYVRQTEGSRPYQGYAVMTLCRALYTVTTGEQVSKKRAAEWAIQEFPQYADLIRRAFIWREHPNDDTADPSVTYVEVRDFVLTMIEEVNSRAIAN